MKKLPAPAIIYGLEILKIIAKYDEIGFNKIQEITGINTNSLIRYLTTLQELNYIIKEKDSKYRPGFQLVELEQPGNVYTAMKKKAEKYLMQLVDEFCMVAMLFGISHRGIYCLDKVTCDDNVSMHEIGSQRNTDICCSWGMLYLASMSKEDIHEFMQKRYKDVYEKVNQKLFYQAVDFTKNNGYCDDKETSRSGIRKIAFPIFDGNGNLIGALCGASFSSMISVKAAKTVTHQLREYAKLISLELNNLNFIKNPQNNLFFS